MHIRVVLLWLPCERAALVQEGSYQSGWQQGVLLLSEDPCWSPASESIMRCTLKAVQVSSMSRAVQVHLYRYMLLYRYILDHFVFLPVTG